jgi:Ser/Thr protein kinase RdoA (MazF antagonist)
MHDNFARELLVYTELRDYIDDWAPQFYGHFSLDGWDILVLEDLGPKSVPPWTPRQTGAIMRAFGAFHVAGRALALPAWLKSPSEWVNDVSHLWAWTRDRDAIAQRAVVAGTCATEAARWFEAMGFTLASEASRLLRAGATQQLLHCDARSDNLRWKDGRLYLFDWASVVAGPAELDVAVFAQTITVESGLAPEQSVAWYEEVNPLDPRFLDAAVCTAAGYFADQAWREELPGLPRLRTFQRHQMAVTLQWALRRLNLEAPAWLNAMNNAALTPLA